MLLFFKKKMVLIDFSIIFYVDFTCFLICMEDFSLEEKYV